MLFRRLKLEQHRLIFFQVEFRPEISKEAADAGLLTWLMKRLKVKVAFDNNKLYASEILSILLQVKIKTPIGIISFSFSLDTCLH